MVIGRQVRIEMTGSDATDTTAVDTAFRARQDVRPEVRRGFSQQKRARRRRSLTAAAIAVAAGMLVLAVPGATTGHASPAFVVCNQVIASAAADEGRPPGDYDLAGCLAEASTMTGADLLDLIEAID